MLNTHEPNIGEVITMVLVKTGQHMPIMSSGYVNDTGVAFMFSIVHNQFIHIPEDYRVVGWMEMNLPDVSEMPGLAVEIDVIPF